MDKRTLSERDVCTKFITPALRKAGWDEMLQIREEVGFTKGRIIATKNAFRSGELTAISEIYSRSGNLTAPYRLPSIPAADDKNDPGCVKAQKCEGR